MSRTARLGEQIRMEVSELLVRKVHDPGVGFLTITKVRVSEDLQHARVFYTTLGDDAGRRQTARALTRVTPFVRRQLAERLRLRRAPELTFSFDQSVAHQARVEELLQEIHRQEADAPRDGEPQADPADGDDR
jgi:ribosome-binding factor A